MTVLHSTLLYSTLPWLYFTLHYSTIRAGGKGRPVRPWPYRFWGRKNGVAWILTYACVIEWPLLAVRRSLGCLIDLRTFSSFQASKVAAREFRFLSFCDIYSDTSSRGERANWGGANMRASYVAVISGSWFNRFSSYKNYRWGDSSSILTQTWPQKRSQSA